MTSRIAVCPVSVTTPLDSVASLTASVTMTVAERLTADSNIPLDMSVPDASFNPISLTLFCEIDAPYSTDLLDGNTSVTDELLLV